jgi:F0F1-type ATP synthase assembly protein I
MAENTQTSRDDDLAVEVARLKREIANLKRAISERVEDIAEGAGRAAGLVTQPIRNNPGATGLVAGALVGLLAGLFIAQMAQERPRHWYDRYR